MGKVDHSAPHELGPGCGNCVNLVSRVWELFEGPVRAEDLKRQKERSSLAAGQIQDIRDDIARREQSSLKNAMGRKKVQLQLVPPAAILEAAVAMEEGAAKYGPYNWREPGAEVELMQYLGAIKRHVDALLDGEDLDPESANGKTHLGGILATAAVVADARECGTLIDDRPPRGRAAELLRERARS